MSEELDRGSGDQGSEEEGHRMVDEEPSSKVDRWMKRAGLWGIFALIGAATSAFLALTSNDVEPAGVILYVALVALSYGMRNQGKASGYMDRVNEEEKRIK